MPPPPATPSSSDEPVIDARDLSKTFGRGSKAVEALKELTFRVEKGESVALLGANGSGKSTTLKLVLGLLDPTSGSVRVLGGPAGRRDARAATGFVPEEARRLPTLRGREVVDLFARLQGVGPRAERKRRVDEALALCGLDAKAASRPVSGYSRGMTRRVSLAAAWVHRPRLLILDEPTSGLDPLGTDEILALLRRHKAEGGTILLSTHDRVTAEGACDRAIILVAGRQGAAGDLAELLAGDTSPSLTPLLKRVAGG